MVIQLLKAAISESTCNECIVKKTCVRVQKLLYLQFILTNRVMNKKLHEHQSTELNLTMNFITL